MQLESFLEQSAANFPDKTAIVSGGRRVSYRRLEADCNKLAHALIASGLERGDRVAIFLENSVEAVQSVFAVLKAGGVFLMVNPTTKPDKLAYILNNSRAAALIAPARKAESLDECFGRTPHLETVLFTGQIDNETASSRVKLFLGFDDQILNFAAQSQPPVKRCIDIDLAALIYTSGSTGNPKGVMLTHLNMVSAARSITTYLANRADDIILNVLPLSFDYGLYQALMSVKIGGTLVLEKSFAYPHAILNLVAREKVTGFPLVPTMAAILLQMDLAAYDFSTLRYLTNTAAALPTEHIRRLRDLFPCAKLFSMYGLTECKRVSYLPPEQLDIRPDSVGRGMPNEEVYVVDDAGKRLGPGLVGELVVRGANVMRGYWENPEETAKKLKPGPLPGEMQLHTGDLFRTDDEGFLYFVGRKDDIIKSRGEKVAPREIENVLSCHPAVAEAAVVGIPDAILGQAIKAVVSLRPEHKATEADLRKHCSLHLEDFLVPQIVEIRETLPKTGNGKIDKKSLCVVE